jgi:hypothetical protein
MKISKSCVTNPPIPSPSKLRCTYGVFLCNFSGWPYDATNAAVLQQFPFHTAGAPFKVPTFFFKFSLQFSECRKKTHRKIVERLLYSALTGTAQLFSSASTIFPPLCWTDCLCAPARHLEGNRSAPLTWHWLLEDIVSKDYNDIVYKKVKHTLNVCFRVLSWAIKFVSYKICILFPNH